MTDIVAAQQGGVLNWTLFTNPLAVAAAMLSFLGSMMRPPFDVVIAPQEIPIGPPTEYHSSYLALMQTNRAIFPIAKIVIYMNLFFGGADDWPIFFLKVFLIYMCLGLRRRRLPALPRRAVDPLVPGLGGAARRSFHRAGVRVR